MIFGLTSDQRLVLFLGNVEHEQLLVHVDLRRRKADAGRLVHRLEHVGGELLQRRVEHGDRRRLGAQALVGEFEDRELGHGLEMRFAAAPPQDRTIMQF